MYSLLFLAITSFVLSLVLTPIARVVSQRMGLMDHPDAARKLHECPIPRVGGIAVALAFVLSYVFWWLTPLHGSVTIQQSLPLVWRLTPAAALVFIVGLLDDVIHLNARWKFAGQIAAASLAYVAGVQVHGFGGAEFSQWWWTFPATVLWLVACCNAINLIDGVDGLAAGLSLVATGSMLLAAALGHDMVLAFATVPLVGCLVGFLRYNFNPASVFLGDCGSLFIGFLLGCYGVLWSQKAATVLGMTAPLIALAIPLLDTSISVARRFLRRQPIFSADRGHIHHRLLDSGLTPRRTALILYAAGALAAMCSLFMANNHLEVPVVLIFGVATWMGIQRLGYIEFGIAGRLIRQGSFRGLLNSQIALDAFETKLMAARTPGECWRVLETTYGEFGFCRVEMRLGGHTYTAGDLKMKAAVGEGCWHIAIPLLSSDYVEFTRYFEADKAQNVVPELVNLIRSTLTERHSDAYVPLVRAASVGN
jgi:UDP-GlcNAc:undecaprenyl-phosphate GlcNAc-1-phosphate transferase